MIVCSCHLTSWEQVTWQRPCLVCVTCNLSDSNHRTDVAALGRSHGIRYMTNSCLLMMAHQVTGGCFLYVQSRRQLLQTRELLQSSPPPPPPPSQEEQTLEQILAAVTTLQTGQTTLQTDIDALQVQVDAANAAATVSHSASPVPFLSSELQANIRLPRISALKFPRVIIL